MRILLQPHIVPPIQELEFLGNIIIMNWHITFFSSKVEQDTLNFPSGITANLLHIFEMIEKFGPALGKPYTAPMGNGLFEIRAKGKEGIGRSLFCMLKCKELVVLHSFIKKTSKTPAKELNLAKKRMKEVKNGSSDTRGF